MQRGNLELFYLCSQLCDISYLSDESIVNETRELGLLEAIPIRIDKDACFIGETNEANIIVFRGIDNFNDVKDCISLKNRRLTNSDIPVHSGFYERYIRLWNFLFPYMNRFYNNKKKIILTGHSLGGALATLFSMRIDEYFARETTVITFASPKVGKGKWKRFINDKIRNGELSLFNIINKEDLIPRLPLWIFGWRRPGEKYRIGVSSFFSFFKELPVAHEISEYKRLLHSELNKI